MDLNSIAQSGKDPKSGRYLSSEERKAAFRKSLGKKVDGSSKYVSAKKNPVSAKRGGGSSGGGGGALAKKYNFKVIEKLIGLKKVADELLKTKQERVRLESKFAAAQKIAQDRENKKKEESKMESGSSASGKNIFTSFASKAAAKAGGGLFGILKAIIAYGILDWISKPENKATVQSFVKVFMGIFKFFNMFVGTMVGSLLGGFTRLFGGGSILERVFGGLQLIFGIFLFKGFTRVLNPLKLIGDIKWAIKNAKNFKNLFGSLFSKNLKGVGDAIKQIFPKTASIFKKGLQGALKRVFLKVFGKGIFTFLKPFVKTITRTLVRPLAKAVTKVPVIGTLLAIPINMFLGDPIDKAAVKAIGAGIGTFVVGALGSVVPGAGTVLGGLAGGLLGDFLAGWLYDSVLAPLGKTIFGGKKDQPQLNTGGIASGPTTGYDVTLHGTEAVIPVDKLKDIILMPYKTVASIIMGATIAVLKSMGAVGNMIAPIALQMFNPFIRIFGLSIETFSSGLGKGADLLMSPASAKEPGAPEDYLQENTSGTGKTTGGQGAGKPGSSDEKPDGEVSTLVPEGGLKGLTDADWKELAFIVSGEAGPGDDRYGVAATVLNRVASSAWPNTIREVGRQSGQFEAVEIGTARYDQKLADDLKNNQGKIAAALKKLNGRDSFKGQTQLSNMGPGDVMLDPKGNFYHYRQQQKKNDPAPGAPDQSWKKWIQAKSGGKILKKRRSSIIGMGEPSENTYDKIIESRIMDMQKFAAGGLLSTNGAVGDLTLSPSTPFSQYRLHHNKSDSHPYNVGPKRINKIPRDYVIVRDFNNQSLDRGAPVVAGVDGKVVHASGYTVVIAKNGIDRMQFHHFDKITARVGQSVSPSTVIGLQGNQPGGVVHVHLDASAADHKAWAATQLGGKYDASSDQSSGTDSSAGGDAAGGGGGSSQTAPEKPALDMNILKDLYTILTGKSGSESPPAPPSPPAAPPAPTLPPMSVPSKSSALPSMSSQFTLDRKMSNAHGIQPSVAIINSTNTNLGAAFQVGSLNNKTITETANLNLL